MENGFNSHDPKIAKALNFIMDKNLGLMTDVVKRCYTDYELLRDYKALRNAYRLEDWDGKSNQRELIRFPHPYVAKFIDAEMTKKYGPLWKQDKKEFRKICRNEELLHPWLLVPKDKI